MSDWKPTLTPTGIGTVPMADPDEAIELILQYLPEMPFWPQLSKRSPWEDMVVQSSPGLPLLKIEPDERRVSVDDNLDRAEQLTSFYEDDMNGNHDRFGLTIDTAPGYFALNEKSKEEGFSATKLKGHVTGPITMCLAIKDAKGKDVIHDPELSQALARGFGLKGAWQARNFNDIGTNPLIFLDEPALTGFGSAFMAVDKPQATELLNLSIGAIHEADALVGIHICGNTDWTLPLNTETNLVNFDAFGFGEGFCLFHKDITAFLERGGIIAWGIVPTKDYTGKETPDQLAKMLEKYFSKLKTQGIAKNTIIEQSILTPSCGMGSLELDEAKGILTLLAETYSLIHG
jgi:methionine synthase II (cobalamin-independent)